MERAHDDTPESLGAGRYRVEALLGAGSQGETFAALDTTRGERVAIKRFRVRGARSWKDVELAEREARVLAGLDHPNIPGYVAHFEEDGALCLVTELVPGESLAKLSARGASLDEAGVMRLLRDAGATLAYLHDRAPPVIHRDIKPGNVIRRPDGSYALIDFGAVRDKMKPDGGSTVVGTFGYMAPEMFQGRATPASDVYALGATALRMLTGLEPEAMPHRGLAIDVAGLLRGRASRQLTTVLQAMLEPDPEQRPSRVLPLLENAGARASQPVRPARAESDARGGSEAAKQNRRERRRAEHLARRQGREERRARARAENPESPVDIGPGGRVLANIGLTVARLVVRLVVGAVVPALLAVLGAIFGPALTRAARAVHQASLRAAAAIARARARVGLHPGGPTAVVDAGVRVDVAAPRGTDPRSDDARAAREAREQLAHRRSVEDARQRARRR